MQLFSPDSYDVSIVFESFQARIALLCQSIIAARYMNPPAIGTYVISPLHTWLAYSATTCFLSLRKAESRYGYVSPPAFRCVTRPKSRVYAVEDRTPRF